jgi:hypothetical protein
MGESVPNDPKRKEIYDRLKAITDSKSFQAEIGNISDDGILGYLRYDFNWHPDPRQSTWQAIEINRLLTRRKDRRLLLPTWIGIVVTGAIALAALVVSILELVRK